MFLVSGHYWQAKCLFAVLVLAFLRTFPAYQAVQTGFVQATWQAVQIKLDHPLTDMAKAFPPASHEAKLTFRMTVPLLAHALRLKPKQLLFLSALVGVFSLYLVLSLTHRLTEDRIVAFLICLAIACAWAGQTAFHEFRGGYYDAVALCALLLAMSARSPVIAGVCAFVAAWTDERALIALPLVLFIERGASRRQAAVVCAGLLYVALRIALAGVCETPVAGVGLAVFFNQISTIPLGLWTGLGGCWLLVFYGLGVMLKQQQTLEAIAYALGLTLLLVAAALVTDVTRSASYCLPSVFAAVFILRHHRHLREVALLAAALSILIPSFYVEGQGVYWLKPLFF